MQIYAYSQAKESFNAGVELVNQDWHNQEFCVGKTCLCNGIKLKYTNFDADGYIFLGINKGGEKHILKGVYTRAKFPAVLVNNR